MIKKYLKKLIVKLVRLRPAILNMSVFYATFNKKLFNKNKSLFKDIQSQIDLKIPNLNFICPLRTIIFKTLLDSIFNALLSESIKLTNKNVNNINSSILLKEWEDVFERASKTWHSVCKEKEIFDFVITEYDKYYKDTESLLKSIISSIIKAEKVYDDNEEKSNVILQIIDGILGMILSDAGKTCNKINGRLKGKTYKNVKCQKCDLCDFIEEKI